MVLEKGTEEKAGAMKFLTLAFILFSKLLFVHGSLFSSSFTPCLVPNNTQFPSPPWRACHGLLEPGPRTRSLGLFLHPTAYASAGAIQLYICHPRTANILCAAREVEGGGRG